MLCDYYPIFPSPWAPRLLLYNFAKKGRNNSQNESKYTAIFGQLVICILPVRQVFFSESNFASGRSTSCMCSCMLIWLTTFQSFFIGFLFQKQLYNKQLIGCFGIQYRCIFSVVLCILTCPAGSSKYCRTRENIQQHCTPKHPIRYM